MTRPDQSGSVLEVFSAFLKLGLTAFGGPIAHLGYFHSEFVERRCWLSEAAYAELIALCQFLPGPASSQVGFALGMQRAGLPGGLAAWTAFTLPSAALLVFFASLASQMDSPMAQSALHGLKLVAVVVVAHALWGMAQKLCPDRSRAAIALAALVLVTLLASAAAQLAVIAMGATLGLLCCSPSASQEAAAPSYRVSRGVGACCLAAFVILLLGLPTAYLGGVSPGAQLFDAFYRAGAMVFGGGHVVLPLLEAQVVDSGWVGEDAFLAGYGAAQAIPGPLFTFAAYLGAVGTPLGGLSGATVALLGIFVPGLLLLVGVMPFWNQWRQHRLAYPAMAGANAAVVGLLAATLYHPVWTSAVLTHGDFAIAAAGFVMLLVWRTPAWLVVLTTVAARVLLDVV